MWYGIGGFIIFAAGFGFGIIYRARKIRPIVAILKDSTLTAEDKIKKILDVLV